MRLPFIGALALLLASVSTAEARRTPLRVCRPACRALLAECLQGLRPGRCARLTLRRCRRQGVSECPTVTSTTLVVSTTSSTRQTSRRTTTSVSTTETTSTTSTTVLGAEFLGPWSVRTTLTSVTGHFGSVSDSCVPTAFPRTLDMDLEFQAENGRLAAFQRAGGGALHACLRPSVRAHHVSASCGTRAVTLDLIRPDLGTAHVDEFIGDTCSTHYDGTVAQPF